MGRCGRAGGTGARASDWTHPELQTSNNWQGPLKQQLLQLKVPAPCRLVVWSSPAQPVLSPFCLAQKSSARSARAWCCPSHVMSCFRRFWILSPVFKLTLLRSQQAPASQHTVCRPRTNWQAKGGHGPPSPTNKKKRSVNQRGRASTSGDQIPTDTPSWRTRQFKTPIPSRNIYFIILRIDLDLHPSHPTCHPICSSRGLATPAQAHHHCTPVVGAGCRVVLTRRFRPASSSPFPGLENTPSTAAGPSSHRVT